jgi:5-methylcytosine-specific restriction endonuclease McrA
MQESNIKLFCMHCFGILDIKMSDQSCFITCPHCNKIMTVHYYTKNGIKIFYLKHYEEVA